MPRKDVQHKAIQHSQSSAIPEDRIGPYIVQAKADTVKVTGKKQYTFLLALGDLAIFGAGLVLLHMLFRVPTSVIPINLGLFVALSLAGKRYELEDGQYSLGKSLLLGAGLIVINLFILRIPGSFPALAVLVSMVSLFSGLLHYKISEPFQVKGKKGFYFRLEKAIKRVFDCLFSGIGFLAVSPLVIITAIAICLESKGSPIYCQTRIGKNEQTFLMLKLRSMTAGYNEQTPNRDEQMLYKRSDDPRITRIGQIIRKFSVDELPQLINVIRGEMSLVGPRPPIESEFANMNWYHRRKFEATPGLTGLWQVTGRVSNQRDFNSVAFYDVSYIENWCLVEDLKILYKTIGVVLLQKGAW